MFGCAPVTSAGSGGEHRLIMDLAVICYSPAHTRAMFLLGVPMTLFYVVGSNIVAWRYLKHEHSSNNYLEFLIVGYRTDANYWFIVVMARKVCL